MGVIFTLDSDTKSLIQQVFDDLITELGKDCQLVYPARWTPCSNCIYDPIGNKSSNHYLTGGPIPFTNGMCPLCNGQGRLAETVSETVHWLCEWEPKKFLTPVPNVKLRQAFSVVQTKGYFTDMPKAQRAEYMLFQLPIQGYTQYRYKLASEPGDPSNIVQGRYFIATWERY